MPSSRKRCTRVRRGIGLRPIWIATWRFANENVGWILDSYSLDLRSFRASYMSEAQNSAPLFAPCPVERRRTHSIPPRSPNLNAHAERFVRSIGKDCLSKLILFSEVSLKRAINEYLRHSALGSSTQALSTCCLIL